MSLGIDLLSRIHKTHDTHRVLNNEGMQPGDCRDLRSTGKLQAFRGEAIPKNMEPHRSILLDGWL